MLNKQPSLPIYLGEGDVACALQGGEEDVAEAPWNISCVIQE